MKKLLIIALLSFITLHAGAWNNTPSENTHKAEKNPKLQRLNMVRDKMRKDLKLNHSTTKMEKKEEVVDFRKNLLEEQNAAKTAADQNNNLIGAEKDKKIETNPGEILRERKRKQREEKLRKIREQREAFQNRIGIH